VRRVIIWSVVALVVVVLAVGGYFYYERSIRYPSTDDAYVKANVVHVAAQVSGRAIRVPVDDQQFVHQGQLLFKIDPQPFQVALAQAQAQLALARQTVAADRAAVQAAQANVQSAQATLHNARLHYHRMKSLRAHNSVSQSALDDARASLQTAKAKLGLSQAKLHQAKMQLGKPGNKNARVQQAQAAVRKARLNLGYTTVDAPCAGQLSNVSLQTGDMVPSGQQLFALVCSNKFWVYANFKETDLSRIRPGQKASISVDMYPGRTFHGVVQSINPASGTAFSLLPPENATGNWVKVTQRVPVRILVTDTNPHYPLRVQTSTEVTIDTGPGSTPAGNGYLTLKHRAGHGTSSASGHNGNAS